MAYKPGTRKKPAGSRKRAAISGKDKAKAAWATIKDIPRVTKEQLRKAKEGGMTAAQIAAWIAKNRSVYDYTDDPEAWDKKFKSQSMYDHVKDRDALDATIKDLPKHIKRSPIVAATQIAPGALKYAKNNPGTVATEAAWVTPWGRAFKKGKQLTATAKKKLAARKARKPVVAMKKGGKVKKCKVDGIAKRGFTKAYSMKKGK